MKEIMKKNKKKLVVILILLLVLVIGTTEIKSINNEIENPYELASIKEGGYYIRIK